MDDLKRGTGRTTRMILAVGKHLLEQTESDSTATIVIHTANWGWMRSLVDAILAHGLSKRIKITSYATWHNSGIGKRPDIFFDHHCFTAKVEQLRAELERLEVEYTKYDL